MFEKTRTYQIGSDPRHTVKLTEQEAHVINNTVEVIVANEEERLYLMNMTTEEMKIYRRACVKLNDYIEKAGDSIPWDESLFPNFLTLVE